MRVRSISHALPWRHGLRQFDRLAVDPDPIRTNARYGTVPMESEVQHPMTKTTSSQYRRLIGECRERWNRFDPIGIRSMGAVHLNEYDSYLAHTAELLLADADSFKIAAYVRQVVRANMGLSNYPEERIVEFAQELRQLTA